MKKIIFTFLMYVFALVAKCQTAIYFCYNTGAVGCSVGTPYVLTNAYNTCLTYGGIRPTLILSTPNKGYGCIVVGYNAFGTRFIGVSAACGTDFIARQRAINACLNAGATSYSVYSTWYDL